MICDCSNSTSYYILHDDVLFYVTKKQVMEIRREDEVDDMSLSPPTMGSMQIAGSNGFAHNIEFMSEAYLNNKNSEIDIEDDSSVTTYDHPLPIYLKVMILSL